MSNLEREARAEARRRRAFIRQVSLEEVGADRNSCQGAKALSRATPLTREHWLLSERPWPTYG